VLKKEEAEATSAHARSQRFLRPLVSGSAAGYSEREGRKVLGIGGNLRVGVG
jgi:hypothetical protein